MSFEKIKETYKKHHEEFLKENPILIKYMDHGIWAPSLPKEIFKAYKKYEDKSKVFLDLGSGDGIAVMVASLFFRHAHGIELDESLFNISNSMKQKLSIQNTTFIKKNFYDVSFTDYDFLYMAPDQPFSLKLEKKLKEELNGMLMVYSSIFQPKTLKKVDEFETNHFTVCVYENKAKKV